MEDQYAAQRLAQDAAALAKAEIHPADDLSDLAGDEERDPALGFYLILGMMVAALLAVVWLSGSRQPVDGVAIPEAVGHRTVSVVNITTLTCLSVLASVCSCPRLSLTY